MKAMILAAGKGARVRPLTYDLPKPMVPILGKPVMAYLVEHLARHGVTDIMVNVSHLHEKIEEYFAEGAQFGVRIGYSFEGTINDDGVVLPSPLGSAGGMRKVQDHGGFFSETTIVLCGDALIDLDLGAALEQHRRSGALATVIAQEVPWDRVQDYGVIEADADGRVLSFQEKPARKDARANLASIGVYIFEPLVLDLIPPGRFFDIAADLFPLLLQHGVPFHVQKRDCRWIDIDSVTDYWSVLQRVLQGEVVPLDMPGSQIGDGVWIGLNSRVEWEGTVIEGPVYIGSGCHIEAGCRIVGPAWIGHGSHLCSGSVVVRSVLFAYTRIVREVCLYEMIVSGNYSVTRGGEMLHIADSGNTFWRNSRQLRDVRPRDASLLDVLIEAGAVPYGQPGQPGRQRIASHFR